MSKQMEVKFTSHLDEVMAATEEQIHKALEMIGMQAEGYAKDNLTAAGRVDTGNLRNSITHEVDGNSVAIGTNVEYAVYHEIGTGIFAEEGGGRQEPWVFFDANGIAHMTQGVTAVHYLRDAIENHIGEYQQMLEDCLKG